MIKRIYWQIQGKELREDKSICGVHSDGCHLVDDKDQRAFLHKLLDSFLDELKLQNDEHPFSLIDGKKSLLNGPHFVVAPCYDHE